MEEAWKKKDELAAKRKAELERKKATLRRITRNKIKRELKAQGIATRKQEKERKKKIKALTRDKQFVPLELFEAIPDPEKTTTKADIDL